MTYLDPALDPEIVADPFGYQAALFGGAAMPDEAPAQIAGFLVDPDFDPAIHDGGDDDRDDAEDRPFLPIVTGPAIIRPTAVAQPEPAAETVAEAPAEPVTDASALVAALDLPDAPSSAVNACDDLAEDGIAVTTGRDRVLSFHYTVDHKFIEATGVPLTGDPMVNYAINAMLTDLARAADVDPEGWVSYSRSHDFYSEHSRYKGTAYTYSYVKQAVDIITSTAVGLADEERAKPGSQHKRWRPAPGEDIVQGKQSRLRATPKLLAAFRSVTAFNHETAAAIRMRDKKGKLVNFRDTKQTRDMAKEVRAYEAFMAGHRIELVTDPDVCEPTRTGLKLRHVDEDGNITFQHICPTPTLTLFRSFNRGSFRKGGRWYCWPQALSKKLRARMLINGEAVVELDYSAHHARMLYALRGIPLAKEADPYKIPTIEGAVRDDAKVAFNVLVNASTVTGAHKALLKKRDAAKAKDRWAHGPEVTQALCEAIVARNTPIADDFGSDKGVDLMAIDSAMMTWILKQCMKANLPAFPVHDSVVCPLSREAELRAIMEAAWARKFKASNPCVVRRSNDDVRQTPSSLPSCPISPVPLGSPETLGPLDPDNLDPLVVDNLEGMRTCETLEGCAGTLEGREEGRSGVPYTGTSIPDVETSDRRGAVPSQVSYGGASQDPPGAGRASSLITNLKVIAGGLSDRVDLDEETAGTLQTSQAAGRRGKPGVAASLKAGRSPGRARHGKARPGRRPAPQKASSAVSPGHPTKARQVAEPAPVKQVAMPAPVPLFGDLPVLQRPEVSVKASRPALARQASTPAPAAAMPTTDVQSPSPRPKPAPAPANRFRRPRLNLVPVDTSHLAGLGHEDRRTPEPDWPVAV
ncbi:hypothetical protein AAII07_55325 [Microvirga sp. 0TCS3.31]